MMGYDFSRCVWIATLGVVLLGGSYALGQSPNDLADDQAALSAKFERLQTLAKRIAELAEAEDPERAEQLRRAIRKSQELELSARLQAIVTLLEEEQLAAAARDQTSLADQLQTLLEILLADPNEARIEKERRLLKEALKRIQRQILIQQELRQSLSQGANDANAQRQQELAKEVDALKTDLQAGAPSVPADPSSEVDDPAGQPSANSGEPTPKQRAGQRLSAAQESMEQAVEQMEQDDQEQAQSNQAEAQRALEDAREEIEQALRQLREEEQQRRLTKLATRLRRMLAEQTEILTLTKQTEEDRPNRGRRATRIAASGLANRQGELVATAEGALRLLREDGMSVAFPEVLAQIREDMQGIQQRLDAVKLGAFTQRLEIEVITSLEETIESLDKTIADLEQRQQSGQQGAPGGSQGEPPVVDKLAELRMIRAVQARILRRTKLWEELRNDGQADLSEATEQLEALGQRQEALRDALRNLDR